MFGRQSSSPLKRKHHNEYHDPDYPQEEEQPEDDADEQPGCSKEFTNKRKKCKEESKTEEKAGNENYLQKVCAIIEKEFQQEILMKQQQLEEIDNRLGKAKNLLDKLRYGIVSAYYKKQELPLTSADAASLRGTDTLFDREDKGPQMPLHPSLKKLIGKRPKDLSEVIRLCPKRTAAQNAVQTIRAKSQAQKREERKLKQIIREQGIVIDHSKQTVVDNDVHSLLNATQKIGTQAIQTNLSHVKQEKPSVAAASKTPTGKALNASRLNNKIKHLIVVGNTSKFIGTEQERDSKNPTQNLTHKWLVYVQAKDTKQPLERYVKKVRFFLHHSYRPNDVIDIQSPPFQVSRRGWGEFPIRVQLFFHSEYHQKPVQLVHNIILDQTMSGIQTLGAETLLEIWLRDTNPMDPPQKKEEVKIVKKPVIPQKPKPRLISRSEKIMDDNLLDFLNKIEATPFSISADIEKIHPTVVVTEPLGVKLKTPSPEKNKLLTYSTQQKSPIKTETIVRPPHIPEKSLMPTLTTITTTISTVPTLTPISVSSSQFKQPLFANGSIVSKPMTTFVKLPTNSTQIKFINNNSATTNASLNIPPLRPLTPTIPSSASSFLTSQISAATASKPSLILNKDCKILMPSASVASAVRRTILPIITNTITSPVTTSTFSTNLSNSPKAHVVSSIPAASAQSSTAPKQILQKKLVQLVDSTGKVKYMQMLVAASSASSSVYNFNTASSSVAPKLITMAPSFVKNNTVTNTTQMTNTVTTPLLKSANGASLVPAMTMRPNIFKIVPESMQTKPKILTFSTNAQTITTNSTTTTKQQQQQRQITAANKTIGMFGTTTAIGKPNNLILPVANKIQKSNGNNMTNTTMSAPKNVVFQKEGKLYIIDPLQMKLKQQQKNQVSLLKPQVSLLKRQQKPATPSQQQSQTTTALNSMTGSKLNIASTSTIQMPIQSNTHQLHYGSKQQRINNINSLQLQQMKRILFEKQFLRQEFTNIQSAVEFLLRRLKLIVPKDSLQSVYPFVCHSLQEFHSLTAFKQRACEWLRAKNVSRMIRNHKDLQKINYNSKEKFWSTKEIATFARQYAFTPIIKSLPRPGEQQEDNSQHFMDLVKSELKQEHLLQYDTLTDHHKVTKWVDKVWHTLEDHEQQEDQLQIIDIDTIPLTESNDKKINSLSLKASSSSSFLNFIPSSPADVYLPPPPQLESQCELVSDICKNLNIKLISEELHTNIYHPSTQTVLAQCLQIFIEKLLRQSIAFKQQKQTSSSSSSSSATTQDASCTLLPQDLAKVLASSVDFDFLTNNSFGSSVLADILESSVKQEKS